MKQTSKTIAVFDLDGTITSKDTYLEFIKYCRGNAFFYLGIVVLSPCIILFYLGLYNNDRLKELFFSFFFKKLKVSDVKQKGVKFTKDILSALCYNSALKVLEWHKDNNHDILILTASSDIWLENWCQLNNYTLMCTRFEENNNMFTGKIKGKNCFGEQKKALLKEYLKNNNYMYSYGYGDSASDKYYLELVNKPYLMPLTTENVNKHWKK